MTSERRRFFKVGDERRELVRHRLRQAGLEAVPGSGIEPRPDPASRPLSFGQQRFWFLDQMDPESAAYNLPGAVRLGGPLEVARLAASLGEILRRHEVLRSSYPAVEGAPVQVVAPPAPVELPVVELERLGREAGEAAAGRLLARGAERPFELAAGPLVRLLLVRLGAGDHQLFFNLHHIVADGWSMGILLRELAAFYQLLTGPAAAPPPPELPVQYADFAHWQRRWLSGERLESLLAAWRKRLAGLPVLELPTDRPRPPVQTFRGGSTEQPLGRELTAAAEAVGRRHGATPFMVYMAALQALLARVSGQRDFAVGTPVANRDRPEVAHLIGFFVNTLVLRADLAGDPGLGELLERVRAVATEAYSHAELPFERLVEELQPDRRLAHPPLFQVFLSLDEGPPALRRLGSLSLEPVAVESGTAKVDLSFFVVRSGESPSVVCEYDRDLFDATTVRRLSAHFAGLLAAAVAAPGRPLSGLATLPPPERQQLLVEWNDTATLAPAGDAAPIHALVARWSESAPAAAAVRWQDEILSYGELTARAAALAPRLSALGVAADQPVGLFIDRSPLLVVAMLAVLQSGAGMLSLDPEHPPERLSFILDDALRGLASPVLLTDGRPAPVPAGLPLQRLELASAPAPAAGPAFTAQGVSPDALAYLLYTSGSTGRPKGVAVPHRGLVNLVRCHRDRFGLGAGSRMTQEASISFDIGMWEIFTPLSSGATLQLVGSELRLTPADLVQWAVRRRVTESFLPTPVAEMVLEQEAQVGREFRLWTGGDRLRRRPPPGRPYTLINLYGPTEATVLVTYDPVRPEGAEPGPPPIGRPIANTAIYVLAPRGIDPVPLGAAGELCIAGAPLARGYYRRPALTAERFPPNPFTATPGGRIYRTGDLVRSLPDGRLDFLGRLDRQVKVGGVRVELAEIERNLAAHPALADAVVELRPVAGAGSEARLVAYVVPRALPAPAVEELRGFLEHRLPVAMMPAAFVPLGALPLTPNGKLDRAALPAPEWVREVVTPRTPTEKRLATLWARLLGTGEVGIRDNFFELGGHSLLAARLRSEIRRELEVDLPIQAIFTNPTVADLARRVDQEQGVAAPPPLVPAPRQETPPLSFNQQGLWFLAQIEPASGLYNLPLGLRLEGPLEVDRLAAAVQGVVRRHEVLRTLFRQRRGRPYQLILPALDLPLPVLDLSRLPEGARGGALEHLAAAESGRPFDLAAGPLTRLRLLRLGGEEHVLLLTQHHIVSDGWSMGLFAREVTALYRAGAAPLPPLPIQYVDFAHWQREWLQGEVLEGQVAYWRRRLAAPPPPVSVPADRPRPAARSFDGATRVTRLPPELVAAAERLGGGRLATLYMVGFAAFNALLLRYTGETDLLVGTPAAGRGRPEVENLIGNFVHMLVMRTRVDGEPSFQELLAVTREGVLEALAHQEVPLEKLVEEIQPERDLGRQPLFSLVFSVHQLPPRPLDLPGLEVSLLDLGVLTSKFDLTLALTETDGGVTAAVEYRTDLFDATTAARLLGHYRTLLVAAVAAPERRVSELPLLTAAERAALAGWNDTATPYPRDQAIHRRFRQQARLRPEAVAVVGGGEVLTYRQLGRRAGELAGRLRRAGVGGEDRVALAVERSPELPVALLAILEAGGAYLPLDRELPAQRLAWMLADGGVRVMVTDAAVAAVPVPPEVRQVPVGAAAEEVAREAGPQEEVPAGDPEALAYLMYTSGSTGVPKGVAVRHRGVVRLVCGNRFARFTPDETFLQLAPASFDASTLELWGPLLNGGRLTLAPPGALTLEEIGCQVARNRVTTLWLTAGLFHRMVDGPVAALAGLGQLLAGGDALSPERVRAAAAALPGCRLINGYGPTENTTFTCCHTLAGGETGGSVPIGAPIANTRAWAVDRRLREVPCGVPGELVAGGDGLARGYWRRPALTAEAFVPDPLGRLPGERLYRTGDRVRRRGDGAFEFLGRLDQQVKLRGYRVEPGEVEAALADHPAVREAVVVARPGPGDDKRLVAYAVAAGEDAPPAELLREHLARRLPAYMVPAEVVFLSSLPLTPRGKVDRRALPAPESLQATPESPPAAPAAAMTPAEEELAALWSEVLGGAPPGVEDDFFDSGGHSLSAIQLISRVREVFGRELSIDDVFDTPTLGQLAAKLSDGEGAAEGAVESAPEAALPPIEALPRQGAAPLSFAQQRLWFLDQLDPGSPAYNMPFAVRLRGELSTQVLERCLGELARRHEILRTVLPAVDGEPCQEVLAPAPVALPVVDLEGLGAEDRHCLSGELARRAGLHRFDLAAGPLQVARLLRLAAGEHLFLLTQHHVVSDGWSLGVLMREMGALYQAFLAGRPSPLAELPVQYADFARWQRRRLDGAVLERHLAYWTGRLGGELPALALPADRPRPEVQTFRGAGVARRLPAALLRRLAEQARRHDATLFMAVLAAVKVLLARLAGVTDVVVGSPSAGRNRREIEGLIGFFVNTLVLRTDLGGDPTFGEALDRVRETTLGAFAHEDLPFELLVETLAPDRDLARTPLFQVFFNFLNFRPGTLALPDLELAVDPPAEPPSKFDWTFYVSEVEEELHLELLYNADLFRPAGMEEVLAQLEHLLDQVVAEPEVRIGDLSLLTAGARRLLPDPAAQLAAGDALPVHLLFARQAEQTPDRVAVADRDGAWSYRELDRLVDELAGALTAAGLGRGAVVAVYGDRSGALAWALPAVLKAGAAFLVLDSAYPGARLAEIFARVEPRGWLALESAGAPPPELVPALEALPPERRFRLPRCGSRRAAERSLASIPAAAAVGEAVGGDLGGDLGGDDLAYVAVTSGTTGRPKAIAGTHGPLAHFIPWHAATFGLGGEDRFALLSGLSHDPALRDLFTPLALGATLWVPAARTYHDPFALTAWLGRRRVSVAHLTPSLAQMLGEAAPDRPGAGALLPDLRLAFFGGDRLAGHHLSRLRRLAPAVRAVNFYGATETPQAMGFYPVPGGPEAPADGEWVPLGHGIEGVQLLVLDAAGRQLGVGEVGEVHVRTPHLARGYLGDDELTRRSFLPNPATGEPGDRLYRTGDLGRYLPGGAVAFCGRVDDQVKIRGYRVEPGEVERLLRRHPAVRDAAVTVRRDDGGEACLVAYVVLAAAGQRAGETPVDLETVRDFVAEGLPAYMVPRHLVRLYTLPRGLTGKVDRAALPAPPRPEAPAVPLPRDPVEEVLAGIWCQVLGLEQVAPGDDFFRLGGHSLRAAQVVARVRRALGVELPVRALFEAPTLAGLARRVAAARRRGTRPAPALTPLPRDGELSLSFAQERLWFLAQLDPDDVSSNLPTAVRLAGALDLALLERALSEVIRRQESLRTTLATVDGRPVAVIAPPRPYRLPVVDLQGLGPAGEAAARRLAGVEARRPFDLTRGPLCRVTFLRLGPAAGLLLATLHHVIADGWSLGVLTGEVMELYAAAGAARPPALAELPVQYVDYAAWQRRWLTGEALEAMLEPWRRRLGPVPPVLELPTDRPRPRLLSHRGGRLAWALPAGERDRLASLAREHRATLFMVLLAAFQAWLHRLSGARQIVVGTPVAGRALPEVEPLVGLFANTLALPAELADDPPFGDHLARVRETTLEAYAHQHLPFEKLVDALEIERSLSHSPLFQVMLALQNAPPTGAGPGELEVVRVEVETGAAQFDLSLFAGETAGGLEGRLEYNADLFDRVTVQRLGGQLRRLLASLQPSRRLSELGLLSAPERHQLTREWNDAGAPPPGLCLHALVEAQAARTPEAVAVACHDRSLSYRGLVAAARRLARRLRRLGVGPEARVGVCLDERRPELVVALLAVLEAGGAYLPMEPSYPPRRRAWLLADAGASVLLTTPGLEPEAPPPGLAVVLLDRRDQAVAAESADPVQVPVSPENLAYVIYTSGSTGRPKGVAVRHAGATGLVAWSREVFSDADLDGVLAATSIAFDLSVFELFVPLARGGRVILVPDALALVDLPAAPAVTLINTVPTVMAELLRAGALPPSVATVNLAGEPLKRALVDELYALPAVARVLNLYGPSEDTTYSTWAAARRGSAQDPAIGRAIPGTRALVVDRRLEPVPPGVAGELGLGGGGLARGYLGRPSWTARAWVPDPSGGEAGGRLYRTGDRVRARPGGELEYLGRIDHQVKVRGFRVEPGEVEAALVALPAIAQAVVVARQRPGAAPGQWLLAAYLVPRPGHAAPPAGELRHSLGERLPDHLVPAAFVPMEALPVSPNGKLDRAALPPPEGPPPEALGRFVAPRTPQEEALAAIWAEVLGRPRVGVHDNFFELGGDSILSIQIVSRARRAGLDLQPRQIFQHQTVAELAAAAGTLAVAAAEQGPVVGPLPLTPIQRHFFALDPADRQHWNQAVLLAVEGGLAAGPLHRAVDALMRHHDALRLRFVQRDGAWRQRCAPPVPGAPPCAVVDLGVLAPAAGDAALAAAAAGIQTSLDLAAGPLVRVAGFHLPGGGHRLLVAVHHLAVDAVSWRILLEDLHAAYRAAAAGERPELPPKTTSYRRWAHELADHARSPEVRAELGYWVAALRGPAAAWPRPGAPGEDTEGAAETVEVGLDEAATTALLSEVPGAYNTVIDEVLLCALARAAAAWTGPALRVELEGHGRGEVLPHLDLSRTVGWLTTLYPVRLDLEGASGPGGALKRVKEQLRRLPNRGVGYALLRHLGEPEDAAALAALPPARISYNYLGRLDGALPAASPFRLAPESPGPSRSPRALRSHPLEVSGNVAGGRLRIFFRYGPAACAREEIEALAAAFRAALVELIEHCRSLEEVVYTPSDFPDVELAGEQLDRILAEWNDAG